MRLKIFLSIIFSTMIFFVGCGQEDSPEIALNEIKIALAERNSDKLSKRVDLDKFFSATYDAVTLELAKNYDDYKIKYPDDPYFQHSAEFITNYNAEHKNLHLKFLDDVKKSFFAKIPAPVAPEENPAAYVANEFEKVRQAANATITETRIDGDNATIFLEVQGDNSLQGQFIGKMIFKLSFHRDKKNFWHLDEISNLDELTPALVDKAELVWITFQ